METTTNRFAGLFEKLSFGLLLVLGLGLFTFFIPVLGTSIDTARAYFVGGLTLLSLVSLIISFFFDRKKILFPFSKTFFVIWLLPLVFTIASFFSDLPIMSFIGIGFEPFSAFMVIIYGLVAYLAAFHAQNLSRRNMLFGTVILSAAVALVFQFVRIISLGTLLSFNLFTEVITNLAGRWQDLAVLGALFAGAALLYNLKRPTGTKAVLASITLLLGLFFNFLISVPIIWFSLLLIALYAVYITRGLYASSEGDVMKAGILQKKQKVMPFVVSGIALFFIVFQFLTAQNPIFFQTENTQNPLRNTRFYVPFVDTPPTFLSDSFSVVKEIFSSDKIFFGVGPSMFSKEWVKHKPQEVNESPWWAVEYAVAAGLPLTVAAMTGVVGLLAILFFFLVVIRTALRAVRGAYVEKAPHIFAPATLTLALLVILLAYTPGLALSVLAFGLIGILLGDAYSVREISAETAKPKTSFVHGAVFALLALMLVYQYGVRAVTYASIIESRNSTAQTLEALEGAVRLIPVDSYQRRLSDSYIYLASQSTSTSEQVQYLARAELLLASSTEFDSSNYLNFVARGNFYATFAGQEPSAYSQASESYAQASLLNPKNPTIELLKARLEITKGDLRAAQVAVEKALSLKSNYADAAVLLSQLLVEQRDGETALRAAEYAVRSDVNNTSALYQYGMLLYQSGNFEQAIPPLERLVALSGNEPDAGAVYALGDCYRRTERTAQAIQIFEVLNQAIPNNADIEDQLQDLRNAQESTEE